MARNKLKFKQSDLERALRAVKKAGPDFSVRLEPDGSMFIVTEDEKRERKAAKKSCPAL